MTPLRNLVASIVTRLYDEEGQTMAEYGILVAVIALIAMGGAIIFGNGLSDFFGGLVDKLSPA